ncbi:MAG: DNA mismatch repair endonuclease MutL [Opitutales bacterium]
MTDRVANQIAAGEVVQRPAAVAKELIENSIDAGATRIEIEFRNGGKSYLRIEDDGKGMEPDQALLSLERHATSKIRKASDLNEIQTFGFRGEALPSISSVSRFVLRTRPSSMQEGSEIFMNGGKMIHVKECGMPPGTRIEVSHLFNSVPGRRKFLKTEATESTHIIHLSKLYALAHPQIEFTLLEGGRTIFRSPVCKDSHERVREIFGRNLAEVLAPISIQKNDLILEGLVGKPGQSRSTRKEMIFFVNRRPVESKTMTYAVLEAYHTYAPKGRFPPAILFLEMDPEQVDVNVHPAKREIRFRDESKVRTFLMESLLNRNKELSSRIEFSAAQINLEKDGDSGRLVPQIDPTAMDIFKKERGQDSKSTPIPDLFSGGEIEANQKEKEKSSSNESQTGLKRVGPRDASTGIWRFLDQSHGDLAIFSTPDGVLFFHSRAAYDRVLYEQLEDAFQDSNKSDSQALLFPESLELDGIDQKNLVDSLDHLRSVGFELEEFGRNFFRVEGCPQWVDPEKALQFLKDFLEIARESGGTMNPEKFSKEVLVGRATHDQSNRKGFSDQEIIRLAEQLLTCRNPFSCPKGKPTFYEIPKREMEERFKRNL